jgi:hypothetical protein
VPAEPIAQVPRAAARPSTTTAGASPAGIESPARPGDAVDTGKKKAAKIIESLTPPSEQEAPRPAAPAEPSTEAPRPVAAPPAERTNTLLATLPGSSDASAPARGCGAVSVTAGRRRTEASTPATPLAGRTVTRRADADPMPVDARRPITRAELSKCDGGESCMARSPYPVHIDVAA